MQRSSKIGGGGRKGGVMWNFKQMDDDLPSDPQSYFAEAKPNSSLAAASYRDYLSTNMSTSS